MPELVTKYPEVTLQILKEAGAKCATDLEPKILVHCPKQQFCKLPTGEVCIYGMNQVSNMTQINSLDLFLNPSTAISIGALMLMLFLAGMLLGLKKGK